MRIVVIGGTGHVGTYLVPRLVEAGHDVVCVSRCDRKPYRENVAWQKVRQVPLDRKKEEENGSFGKQISAMLPDIVIDMICFEPASAVQLVDALDGQVQQFLHCGTIWVHGHSTEVPAAEEQPRNPFGAYGIKKAQIEEYLIKKSRMSGFPATILHPGHIVGPGWKPVNPAGNVNPEVFTKLARGEELVLPNLGMETVHHVHADDVAQAFVKAIDNRNCAIGESFHIVSAKAVTLRGYAEKIASWFGKQAALRFMPWEKWKDTVPAEDADITYDHIAHSPNCSIAKARRFLNYQPRYSSIEAVYESLVWLIEHHIVAL